MSWSRTDRKGINAYSSRLVNYLQERLGEHCGVEVGCTVYVVIVGGLLICPHNQHENVHVGREKCTPYFCLSILVTVNCQNNFWYYITNITILSWIHYMKQNLIFWTVYMIWENVLEISSMLHRKFNVHWWHLIIFFVNVSWVKCPTYSLLHMN